MEDISIRDLDIEKRIDYAVEESMNIYMNRLANKYIEIGLENTFQMHLAEIIGQILELYTYCPDEKFMVLFEVNRPINGYKDYVDIVIKYQKGMINKEFFIELKFKKKTDSAPDLGNIESYMDIYNLDSHKYNSDRLINRCYFIFLTDLKTYTNISKTGVRTEIPMHDEYTIKKNKSYFVSGKTAKTKTKKYPHGFSFNNDYKIIYKHYKICNKNFWYFILKI